MTDHYILLNGFAECAMEIYDFRHRLILLGFSYFYDLFRISYTVANKNGVCERNNNKAYLMKIVKNIENRRKKTARLDSID